MKTFKTCMNQINGLRFIYDHLEINSSIGRKRMLNQKFITDPFVIQMELDVLSTTIDFIKNENQTSSLNTICIKLRQINDIQQTISNLKAGQVLDDIQLFEIKKFALLSQEIVEILKNASFSILPFYDLSKVVEYLDPEKNRIPHFYIYSSYSPKLEELRKNIERLKDAKEVELLKWEALKEEDEIRSILSSKLHKFHEELYKNLEQIAYLDILIAKAKQTIVWNLCKPKINAELTSFKQLFNPEVKSILEQTGNKFQPIDIELYNAPCLITGANMAGKTVLLKTVALAQFMFQFGFYIPAKESSIMPIEDILFSIGDQQSEMNGLSSFAVEILNINKIITNSKKGVKILALVDELARTTNPEEGKALVNAFIEIMNKYHVNALITTHYSGIAAKCRRLRVKGLTLNNEIEKINPHNLSDFMDYSLIETESDSVPMEALKIAEIFEVDDEFLTIAKQQYK